MAAKKAKAVTEDVTMLTEEEVKDMSSDTEVDEEQTDDFIAGAADELLGNRDTEDLEDAVDDADEADNKAESGTAKTSSAKSNKYVNAEGINVASRRQKRKIYKQEPVITASGDEELKSDADIRREKWLDMVASYKSGKILRGTIVSCRTIGENPGTLVVDVIYENMFTVTIPALELIEISPEDIATENGIAYIKTRLNHRIGSEIDFVIVNELDEKNRTAFGSRLTAMYKKRYAYYVHKHRNAKAPLVTEGKLVKASVVSVNGTEMIVEIFGVETTIKQKDISYNRVESVDELYDVGEEVVVRVTGIKAEKGKRNIFRGGFKNMSTVDLITVTASVKEVLEDPRKEHYGFFHINGDYLGTVVQVSESGVFVNLAGKMDCLCPLPDRENVPSRGSTVLVHVTMKKDEGYQVYGQVKKVIKRA